MKKTLRKLTNILLSALMIVYSCYFTAGAAAVDMTGKKIEYIEANLAEHLTVDMTEKLIPESTILDDFGGFAPSGEIALEIDFTEMYAVTADAVIKYDIPECEYELDATLNAGSLEPIEVVIYANDEFITLRCDAMLGQNKVYGMKLDKPEVMLENFEKSPLGTLMGFKPGSFEEYYGNMEEMTAEATAMYKLFGAYVDYISAAMKLAGNKSAIREITEQLINDSAITFAEESITLNGTEQKVIAAKMELSEQAYIKAVELVFEKLAPSLEAMYDAFEDYYSGIYGETVDVKGMLEDNIYKTIEAIKLAGTYTYYFDKQSCELIACKTDMDMAVSSGEEAVVDMSVSGIEQLLGNRVEADMKITDNIYSEAIDMNISFGLAEKHGINKWDMQIGTAVDDEVMDIAAYFEHDNNLGKYNIGIDIAQNYIIDEEQTEEIDKITYKLSGDLKISENSFEVSLTDITAGGMVYPLEFYETFDFSIPPVFVENKVGAPDIKVSYKEGTEIYAPKKYTDILSLSEAQIYLYFGRASKKIESYIEKFELVMLQGKNYDAKTTKVYGITEKNYNEYAGVMSDSEFYSFVEAYKYYINTNNSH